MNGIIFIFLFVGINAYSSDPIRVAYKSRTLGYINGLVISNINNFIVKRYKTHDPYNLHKIYRNGRPEVSHTHERVVIRRKDERSQ